MYRAAGEVQYVKMDDGRRKLALEITGDPDGYPVFLMHGTPGSRNGPRPRGMVLYRLGLKLISYDRPGYGSSTRQKGRSVSDAAADVAAIADFLGHRRIAVIGRSGGGSHALACAAHLADRVSVAAVLVGLAPSDAQGLDWYAGMNRHNVNEYSTADANEAMLRASLEDKALQTQQNPQIILTDLIPDMCREDRRVVDDVTLRKLLTDTYAMAVQQGADGWIDDVLAFRKPWGFDFSQIRCPVKLWHGMNDDFSPVEHAQWLAEQIENAELEIGTAEGHFAAVEELPKILSWISDRVPPDANAGAGAAPPLAAVTNGVCSPRAVPGRSGLADPWACARALPLGDR